MKKIMRDKKAISQVIGVLIIILLSISALTIVWIAAKKMLEPEKILAPSSCIDLQVNSPYEFGKRCFNKKTNELEITLNKKYDKYLIENAYFIVDAKNSDSSKWCCGTDCENCELPEQNFKKYFIPLDYLKEDTPTEISLEINGCLLASQPIQNC